MRFEKGNNYGKGRPEGSTNKWSIKKLQAALEKVAKEHNLPPFLEYLALQAYSGEHQISTMIMKKLMADLKQIEAKVEQTGYWANKTPDQIVQDMDDATLGEEEEESCE